MMTKVLKVAMATFTLTFLLTGCTRFQESPPIPPEEPLETPIESPVETPVESPLETPVETPVVEDEKEPVITTETVKEEVKIPFTTVKKNDETLEKGKTVVSQKGIDGTETVTYEVTYTDGKETGRKEVGRVVTKKVVEEVVKVGVKVVASAPAPAPKPNPTPAPTTPKPAPTPAPNDEDIPEDELIEIPEPPAPPKEYTPDPPYGTVSFTLPSGTYKTWGWRVSSVIYEGHVQNVTTGDLGWAWGHGTHSMRKPELDEWFERALVAFPKPNRDPAYVGERIEQKVWIWLLK